MNSMEKLTYEQIFQVCMTTLLSTHFTHITYILCITVHALHALHKLRALHTLHYIHYIIWHNITLHIIHTSDSDNYMHLMISSIWYVYIYIKNWLKETKKARTHIISYTDTVHSYYVYICMQVSTNIYLYIQMYMHACMRACKKCNTCVRVWAHVVVSIYI